MIDRTEIAAGSRLVIVLPLRPLAVGDAFTLREWPLHLTVAPTFVIAGGLPAVLPVVAPVLLAHRALVLDVGPADGFGHAMNVPVSLVEPSAELIGLHSRLIASLLTVGARFDHPEFIGDAYRPHITLKGVPVLRCGVRLTQRQAAVVDMAPAGERRFRPVSYTHLTLPTKA